MHLVVYPLVFIMHVFVGYKNAHYTSVALARIVSERNAGPQ